MSVRKFLAITALAVIWQAGAYEDASAQGRGNGNGFGIGNGGGNGNGNGFGLGGGNAGGNGGGRGSGAGAPLPVMGATLLGQAAGAAGLFTLWRRRKRKIKA